MPKSIKFGILLAVAFNILLIIQGIAYYNDSTIKTIKQERQKSAVNLRPGVEINKTQDFLAVATLVKNEGSYLAEWIAFHHSVGVDFFLIYDHGSTDLSHSICKEFVRQGVRIIFIDAIQAYPKECTNPEAVHSQSHCQRTVYKDAINRTAGKTRWLGIFDVDEFLYPASGLSLVATLNMSYSSYDIISIKSTVWGSNGIDSKLLPDPSGHQYPLVLDSFTRRANPLTESSISQQYYGVKGLGNPSKVSESSVHRFTCLGSCNYIELEPLMGELRMNHYQYKSLEEVKLKAGANGNPLLVLSPEEELLMYL